MATTFDVDDPSLPHSAAWLADLSSVNADLSLLIADSLARAGRSDACAVCGEWPASALRRMGPRRETEPATLRLCGDCRLLRRVFYAETYQEL